MVEMNLNNVNSTKKYQRNWFWSKINLQITRKTVFLGLIWLSSATKWSDCKKKGQKWIERGLIAFYSNFHPNRGNFFFFDPPKQKKILRGFFFLKQCIFNWSFNRPRWDLLKKLCSWVIFFSGFEGSLAPPRDKLQKNCHTICREFNFPPAPKISWWSV